MEEVHVCKPFTFPGSTSSFSPKPANNEVNTFPNMEDEEDDTLPISIKSVTAEGEDEDDLTLSTHAGSHHGSHHSPVADALVNARLNMLDDQVSLVGKFTPTAPNDSQWLPMAPISSLRTHAVVGSP